MADDDKLSMMTGLATRNAAEAEKLRLERDDLEKTLQEVLDFCRGELKVPNGEDPLEARYDAGIDRTCQQVIEIIEPSENQLYGPVEENFWDDRTTPLAYSKSDADRDEAARRERLEKLAKHLEGALDDAQTGDVWARGPEWCVEGPLHLIDAEIKKFDAQKKNREEP